MKPLNLFYSEPDPDRWFKYDRYPRRIIRRIVRGKHLPGGVMMASINLMKGLDRIGVPYRLNDYRYIRQHPEEIACVIGKPHLIFEKTWRNPIIFGTGTYNHPIECPDLFERYPQIKRMLLFGEWMRQMFEPYYGNKVTAWPVGIDTDFWRPENKPKPDDFLIYDKIRWNHDTEEQRLLNPIKETLTKRGLSYQYIKYGTYKPNDLSGKLKQCKAVIFLCEHETQGQAYQQMLSANTPVLAWDRGGYWQDPSFYPDKVKFQPVSSVPYWDNRCGMKFSDAGNFEEQLLSFQTNLKNFSPRDYILENLTLEKCAERYLQIFHEVEQELK